MRLRAVWYDAVMSQANWKTRILAAVDNYHAVNGTSDNELSQRAKLGRNYLTQMRAKDPEAQTPRVGQLQILCDYIGESLMFILTGMPLDAEGEELIRLLADAPSETKRHVIGILRRH